MTSSAVPVGTTAKVLVGHNIARLLKERGWDDETNPLAFAAFAVRLGYGAKPYVAASNLRQRIRGEKWPGAAGVERLAEELDVSISELFRDKRTNGIT